MIKEYQSDLVWTPPGVSCDKVISEKIKSPLPNTAHFMMIAGAAGSGKSSLAYSMLGNSDMYHKAFNHIFCVCPPNSRASMKGDLWANHDPKKMFDELTEEVLEYIWHHCEVAAEEEPAQTTLLFLDDVGAELKNKSIAKILSKLIFNRRHLRLSIWCLVQSYNSVPLGLRKNISHGIIFRPRNKKELELLYSEILFLDKKTQQFLYDYVFKDPFSFLYLETGTGKIHRQFNLLEFP
jgi:hypothetical protein